MPVDFSFKHEKAPGDVAALKPIALVPDFEISRDGVLPPVDQQGIF